MCCCRMMMGFCLFDGVVRTAVHQKRVDTNLWNSRKDAPRLKKDPVGLGVGTTPVRPPEDKIIQMVALAIPHSSINQVEQLIHSMHSSCQSIEAIPLLIEWGRIGLGYGLIRHARRSTCHSPQVTTGIGRVFDQT